MAKVFLDANDQFNVSNNSTSVFGTSGEEVVLIANGVTGLTLDQNVERTQFTGSYSDYKYLQAGNQLKVYAADGTTLLATIPLQGDSNGSQLTFTNGTVDVKLGTGGVMSFGGATVSGTTVGSLTPTTIAPTPASPDNTPRFSVAAGADTAAEGGAGASFVVTLSSAQATATTVNFALSGTGGATVGTDTGTAVVSGTGITSSGSTITFAPGSTVATVTVPVVFDTSTETGEGLKLDLSSPSTGTGLSLSKPTSASVTLTDPAAPNFTLTSNAGGTPTQEGSAITFTVTPSSVVTADTNLTVNLQGATVGAITTQASASDFSPNSTSVTFKAGDTAAKTVTVNVVSDSTSEGIEGYKASLLDSGFNEKASVTGTINDPVANLVLSQSASSVNEGSAVTYTVTSSIAAPTGGITVPYTLAGGATLPASTADYTGSAASGTLTIAAGSTTATLALTASTDNTTEGNESLVMTLGNPSSGTVSTSSVTTTINDTSIGLAAGKVVLSQAATSVNEGSTNTYTVTLGTAAPTGGLSIPYTVSGTATNTSDYTGSTGTISVAAGATTGTLTLTTTADLTTEGAETIILTLGTLPTGYSLNSTAEGTVSTTINDTSATPVVSTFTLTTGIDNATNQASISGFLGQGTGVQTWQLTDSLSGTTATNDTLSVTVIADKSGGGTATYSALSTSAIERVNFKYVDGATSTDGATIDTAGFSGLSKLSVANSTVSNTSASDTLTLSNIASGVTLELGSNSKLLDVTAEYASSATAGTNDTVNLSMTGGRTGILTVGTSGSGYENAAITTSGTGNRLTDLVGATIKTITVAGTDLRIDNSLDTSVTSFDASNASGTINVNLTPQSTLTAKGGSGSSDLLTLSAGITSSASISGFETVVANTGATFDLTSVTGATTLGVAASAGNVAFTNVPAASNTLSLSGNYQGATDLSTTASLTTNGTLGYTLKDASSLTDTLNIAVNNGGTANTGTYTVGGLLTATAENLVLTTADWKAVTFTGITQTLSTNAAANVKASGSANLTLGTVTGAISGTNTTGHVYDFSGMTGSVSATFASAVDALSVTGGSGNDTIANTALTATTGTAKTQTFNLAAGNDTMTLALGGTSVTDKLSVVMGAGDDTINYTTSTAAGSTGTVTLAGGTGTDSLVFSGTGTGGQSMTVSGLEKVSFENTGATTTTLSWAGGSTDVATTVQFTEVSGANQKLNISVTTGTGGLDMSNWKFTGWATGDVLTVTGDSSADTLLASPTVASYLFGGGGADALTGSSAVDILAGDNTGTKEVFASATVPTATGTGTFGSVSIAFDGQTFTATSTVGATASGTTIAGEYRNLVNNDPVLSRLLTVDATADATLEFTSLLDGDIAAPILSYVGTGTVGATMPTVTTTTAGTAGSGGADTITGGTGADLIYGGAGADSMTGGTGADTFLFSAGDTGTPSATNFDVITDFASSSDIISFGASLTVVSTVTAAAGTAGIAATTGVVSFNSADNTLALRITAVENGINAGGTAAAGQYAVFGFGSDSYVFISDGTDGIGANDVLIKLAGVSVTTGTAVAANVNAITIA